MKKLFTIAIPCFLILGVFWYLQNSPEKVEKVSINTDTDLKNNHRGLAGLDIDIKPPLKAPSTEKEEKLRAQVKKNYLSGKDKIQNRSKDFKKIKTASVNFKTREFRLKGQRVFISTDYSAIPSEQYSGARSVASINNHEIVKGNTGLPVVQDPVKLRKGVATGHIIVKTENDVDLTELSKKYNLRVEHVVPHLNIVSFLPEKKEDLLLISAKLSESPLIESVKLDISYGGPRAK